MKTEPKLEDLVDEAIKSIDWILSYLKNKLRKEETNE